MTYDIQFTNAANKQFKKLSKAVQRQIKPVIDTLANNPRPHGYIELHGKLKACIVFVPAITGLFTLSATKLC